MERRSFREGQGTANDKMRLFLFYIALRVARNTFRENLRFLIQIFCYGIFFASPLVAGNVR